MSFDFTAYPDPDALPADFGEYTLTQVLGRGGMGVVYRAHKRAHADANLDIEVALKIVHGDLLRGNQGFAAAMAREARVAAAVRHPAVIRIVDFGAVSGIPFLATELLEGAPLDELLQGGALDPHAALTIAHSVAAGLGALHGKGLIHRDVKPSNIYITHHGEVRLLDFGIARGDDNRLTATGVTKGTPGFMSPEQLDGEPLDARSDLFSLGAVIAEIVLGEPLLEGGTYSAILTQLIDIDNVVAKADLAERLDALVPGLGEVITDMVRYAPADRPDTAAEVVAALKRLARGARGQSLDELVAARQGPLAPSDVIKTPARISADPTFQYDSAAATPVPAAADPVMPKPTADPSPAVVTAPRSPPARVGAGGLLAGLAGFGFTGLAIAVVGIAVLFGVAMALRPAPAPTGVTVLDPTKLPIGVSAGKVGVVPDKVVFADLEIGMGVTLDTPAKVRVRYEIYLDGGTEPVDSSDDIVLTYGLGKLTPGFEQGVAGMAVGGRRRITAPAAMVVPANRMGDAKTATIDVSLISLDPITLDPGSVWQDLMLEPDRTQ
jgi:serine/threonine protein kinase